METQSLDPWTAGKSPFRYVFAAISSQSLTCFLSVLTVSPSEPTFFILMKSSASVFPFMDCAVFSVVAKKLHAKARSPSFPPVFSFRSFIGLPFTLGGCQAGAVVKNLKTLLKDRGDKSETGRKYLQKQIRGGNFPRTPAGLESDGYTVALGYKVNTRGSTFQYTNIE